MHTAPHLGRIHYLNFYDIDYLDLDASSMHLCDKFMEEWEGGSQMESLNNWEMLLLSLTLLLLVS